MMLIVYSQMHNQIMGIESSISADIYILKVNKRNTRTRCEIGSKLTIKTPERC